MLDHSLIAPSAGVGLTTRGTKYFVAPGTTSFLTRSRTVNPSDTNTGLTPLVPFASIDHAFSVLAEGDSIVLVKEGTYQLSANISTSLKGIKMVAYPGLNPLNVSVVGVAGGSAMTFIGQDTLLKGFEIAGADVLFPALVVKGRYTQLEDMSITGDCSAALSLKPATAHTGSNKQDASFVYVKRCRFEYVPVGILFAFTAGDFAGATDCRIEENWFADCTTRAIGQEASSFIDNISILRNYFGDLAGATEFIKLDNVSNGGSVKNLIADNVYAHAAVTATQVALTAGGFFHIGNRDKAGFVTGV